jgi:hypothetical protein
LPKHHRQLDISVGISGPHDFAVRADIIRQSMHTRPSHPAPNVCEDRDTPLRARDARKNARDLPNITSERACGTLTRRANHLELCVFQIVKAHFSEISRAKAGARVRSWQRLNRCHFSTQFRPPTHLQSKSIKVH